MKENQNLYFNLKPNTRNLDLNTPLIFRKKLNNKSKIVPLNSIMDKVGPTKHYTPAAQEWFNSVYAYNKNYIKLLPSADQNLMKLVRSYFNLYIKKYINFEKKQIKGLRTRYRRLSVKRIFVGKGNVKHTSTKVIITLYVFNYEKRKFLAKEAQEIKSWFEERRVFSPIREPLVRKVEEKRNVSLSYKRWFNWNSYSLLHRKESLILEKFYLNKFFNKLSLNSNKFLLPLRKPKSIFSLSNNKNFFVFVPLYSDYIRFIYNKNINVNNKPSFNNFITLIRIVKIKNLMDLKKNIIDLNNKSIYLNEIKNYLSRIFVINNNNSKILINFEKLKDLDKSIRWNFKFRNLKRKYLIFKYITYSYKGKVGKDKKKEIKSFTLNNYLFLLCNIDIKNIVDLNKKNVDKRDITLYLSYINKYLNKNLHLVHKNFLINLIGSLFNLKTSKINYSENPIYIDYYRYLFSGEFSYGNNPSFDDFLTLLDIFSVKELESLKDKYKYYNSIDKLKIKGKKRTKWLNNMRKHIFNNNNNILKYNNKDILNYSSKDLAKQAIKFKKETFKHYFKLTFLSLHKLIFNQNKFRNSFMKYLIRLVTKLYNKEVRFNIVNLTKLHLNSDIYTQTLALKFKNRKNSILTVIKRSLHKVKIPYVNRVTEKYYNKDLDQFWVNKVKNIKVNSLLTKYISNKDPLNELLLNFYYGAAGAKQENDINKYKSQDPEYWNLELQDKSEYLINEYPILISLKHRNMAGVRIEAKGRLTRRFTASRSLFKLRWKGGLKNVDSSFKKLSTVVLRGHAKSNVQYSKFNSKRRIGAFGVKGWVSSK